MSVLICAASRHGATREIAFALGDALADEGLRVAMKAPQQVVDLERPARATACSAGVSRAQSGRIERVAAAALHVPDGDRRDWDEVVARAHEIACEPRSVSDPEARR